MSMEGRRVRRARDVFDPSTEWARPQYMPPINIAKAIEELRHWAATKRSKIGDLVPVHVGTWYALYGYVISLNLEVWVRLLM